MVDGNIVKQRILYLDGWRGIAVLSVLAGHYVTSRGLNLGRLGVELFFVLSGRLMAEMLFDRKVMLRVFFPRRFSRVYPALAVFALILLAGAWGPMHGDPTPGQFLAGVTFTINYLWTIVGRSENLDHIWSLCIEEHLYLLLGLIALISRRFPAIPVTTVCIVLAALAILNGVLQTWSGYDYNQVYWRSDVRGASILIGAAAYLLLKDGPPRWLAGSWVPLMLVFAGLILNFNVVPDPIKYSVGTICFATALLLVSGAPRWTMRILEHPALLQVGVWSYSLYLWQQPFFHAGAHAAQRLLLLPVAIACGIASFYLVEQPARRMLNRLWGPERAGAPVAAG